MQRVATTKTGRRRIVGAAANGKPVPKVRSVTAAECADALITALGPVLTVARNTWRAEIPSGMSAAQLRNLFFIVQHSGTSLREMADNFMISMPTASATVNRLVSQGLVAVSNHAGDKRRIALFATRDGSAAVQRASKRAVATFTRTMALLSDTERDKLYEGVKLIIKAIRPLNGGANAAKNPASRARRGLSRST